MTSRISGSTRIPKTRRAVRGGELKKKSLRKAQPKAAELRSVSTAPLFAMIAPPLPANRRPVLVSDFSPPTPLGNVSYENRPRPVPPIVSDLIDGKLNKS
jgi:hypothetical protein